MDTTTNGWPILSGFSDPELAQVPIPGIDHRMLLLRRHAPLWVAVALDWHRTVHTIPRAECYDKRTPDDPSNHRSATACDFNSNVFPQHGHAMTQAQQAAARAIVKAYVTSGGKRILEWGGDWSETFIDQMHVQLRQDVRVTEAEVQDCIRHLGLTLDGPSLSPAASTPRPQEDSMLCQTADGRHFLISGGFSTELEEGEATRLKTAGVLDVGVLAFATVAKFPNGDKVAHLLDRIAAMHHP
jgi:hypothetical protein